MLTHLRQSRRMLQADLADRAGVSDCYISLLESGQRTPSVTVLHRLAQALDLDDHERAALLAWAAEQAESRREAA